MVTGSGINHESQGRAGQKERGQDSKSKMLRRIQGPASQEREQGVRGKEICFDELRGQSRASYSLEGVTIWGAL